MSEASATAGIAEITPPPGSPHLALNYCRLGATDAQLAEFFAVSPETLGGWLAHSREFAAAVRRGRKMADVDMIDSLYRLGMGYVEPAEKVMVCRGEPVVVRYQRHHRPDYRAGMTWLCNRMPHLWKWPGTRLHEEAAVEAADRFTLPLLVDESLALEPVATDEPAPGDDAVLESDKEEEAVAAAVPEHPGSLGEVALPAVGRNLHLDMLASIARCAALGLPPPPQPVLAPA